MVPVLDFLHPGLPLPLKCFACLELSLLVYGAHLPRSHPADHRLHSVELFAVCPVTCTVRAFSASLWLVLARPLFTFA